MNKRSDPAMEALRIRFEELNRKFDAACKQMDQERFDMKRYMGALSEDFQSKLEAFMEIVLAKLDEIIKKLDTKADIVELEKVKVRVDILENR